MKRVKNVMWLVLLVGSLAQAQYNCSRFYPFEDGAKRTYKMTDALTNDHLGMVVYEIERIYETAGTPSATMGHRLLDSYGNVMSSSSYEMVCTSDGIYIDFNSLYRPGLLGRLTSDHEITGTNVVIPNELNVGDELADAGMKVSFKMRGTPVEFSMSIKDRKVIGTETVTTPAGTFDCYIVTQKMETIMTASFISSSKQWLAEGIGLVKQEDYAPDGSLSATILLDSM